jgi:type III secretion protein R
MTLDPIALALMLAGLALVPFIAIVTTAFLKIAMVLMIVRNALGVQSVPPNIAVYGLALILALYIMAPVFQMAGQTIEKDSTPFSSVENIVRTAQEGSEPFRAFLHKHTSPAQREFFIVSARKLWPADMANTVGERDLLVLMPAFVVTELTAAFQIGFLLYLPFILIDLVVSNILLAMGMMMVSPTTISLPFKLLLFVMVDGWTRLIHGLVLSYA